MSTRVAAGSGTGPNVTSVEKVGVVTDDLENISSHFGMAKHYLVYEVRGTEIVGKEVRDKPFHGAGMQSHREGKTTTETVDMHASMLSNVSDCTVIIAGGMGRPMHSAITEAGKRVYITEIQGADEAVRALLKGRLDNHLDLLH